MSTLSSLLNPAVLTNFLKGNIWEAARYLGKQLYLLAHPSIGWRKPAADSGGSAATDTTAEVDFGSVPFGCTVTALRIVPFDVLTQHATDYASFPFGWRDGAGGALQVLGTITTKPVANGGSGSWVKWTTKTLSTGLTNTVLPAGAILTISIGKAAGGVSVPVFQAYVDIQGS